jgi:hypothetical protein
MMNSFQSYTIDTAPAASKPTLEEAKRTFSFVPNLQAHMAESPELLAGYTALWDLFAKSTLPPQWHVAEPVRSYRCCRNVSPRKQSSIRS